MSGPIRILPLLAALTSPGSLLRAQDRLPVVFDTDIGGFVDDSWALAVLLESGRFDLRLLVTASGDTRAAAAVAAKFLSIAGHGGVPIGIGVPTDREAGAQVPWAADYSLADHPGSIHEDGVGAMIETIRASPEPITLIVLGPATNIRAALERAPDIVRRARVIAMSGGVYRGYEGASEPQAEYNVLIDPAATDAMYGAAWPVSIAPLDTAGLVRLEGARYARLLASRMPLVQALIESFRAWAPRIDWASFEPDRASPTLFDPVAVYLALEPESLPTREIRLRVTDDGFTVPDEKGHAVTAALEWKDRGEAFRAWVMETLTGSP